MEIGLQVYLKMPLPHGLLRARATVVEIVGAFLGKPVLSSLSMAY